MEPAALAHIACYAAGFGSVYFISRPLSSACSSSYRSLDEQKGDKGYWSSMVVSTVHALVLVPLCLVALWQHPPFLHSTDFFESTELSHRCCHVFLGYIVYDLILCLYFGRLWSGWQANLVHHVCCLIAWSQLTAGSYGMGIALVAMCCELSTPFLNVVYFMDKVGLSAHPLYLANGIWTIIVFFIVRICCYGGLVVRIYQMRQGLFSLPVQNICVFLTCYLAGLALQSFWFMKMCSAALNAISGKKD
eukprot:TRINITY_DN55286_c0_g1_i1.p1 TRINITY_DN55286_c0_g1~~TRINITY_DN55286_c0_g1_i1.p1  ORF type:complete len:248 (+),score=27.85 TRINITY_DN55286_c0_g1_i1:71-814(+)